MKKYIVFAALLLLPLSTSAALMGFPNERGLWDESGKQLYTCMPDNTCVGLDDKIHTREGLGVGPVIPLPTDTELSRIQQSTPQTVYVPVYIQQPTPFNDQPAGIVEPPTINQSTMTTDNTLVPWNKSVSNFDTIYITTTFNSNNQPDWFRFQWNPTDQGKKLNGEVVFNGQTVLNGNGNAIEYTGSDNEHFAIGTSPGVRVTGPFQNDFPYSFTYNQGNKTVTRNFKFIKGVGLMGW